MALIEKYVSALASGGGDGSMANPWTWPEMRTNIAAGQRANVLAGSYSDIGYNLLFTNAGTRDAPIVIRGVTSFSPLTPCSLIRGADGSLPKTTYPQVMLNTQGAWRQALQPKAYTEISGIRFTANYDTMTVMAGSGATHTRVVGCAFDLGGYHLSLVGVRNVYAIVGCDIELGKFSRPTGWLDYTVGCRLFGDYLSHGHIIGNLLVCAGATDGGVQAYTGGVIGNTIVNTFYGIKMNEDDSRPKVANIYGNIIVGCTYGIDYTYQATHVASPVIARNCLHNCGTNYRGFGDWPIYGDIYADPQFVDAANGDYRLKPTSPAAGLGALRGPAGAMPIRALVPDPLCGGAMP